jgi:hypothetical protein
MACLSPSPFPRVPAHASRSRLRLGGAYTRTRAQAARDLPILCSGVQKRRLFFDLSRVCRRHCSLLFPYRYPPLPRRSSLRPSCISTSSTSRVLLLLLLLLLLLPPLRLFLFTLLFLRCRRRRPRRGLLLILLVSTSQGPFSRRSLLLTERALHAAFVSASRLLHRTLRTRSGHSSWKSFVSLQRPLNVCRPCRETRGQVHPSAGFAKMRNADREM